MLIGRRDPALPISTLRAKRLLSDIRSQDLRFSEAEINEYLIRMLGIPVDPTTTTALAKKTEGWVTGLVLAAFSMRSQGSLDPALLDPQVNAQSVMEYLFTEVFSRHSSEINRYLMISAILDRFCGPLCEAVSTPEGKSPAIKMGGWEFIKWLNKQNLFLVALDHEKHWFRFHHLFQRLLLNQLERQFSPTEIKLLHSRASAWFAENGLVEEALKHALAAGNAASAAGIVAKHGFNLVSEEQWLTLESWLKRLPTDIVYEDPELVILTAWQHLVFARNAEIMPCLDRAQALISDHPYPAEATRRFLGHLDAMVALQKYYSAEADQALVHARRATANIPKNHRYPRILVLLIRVVAYQMIGESEKAQSVVEKMIRDESLRGGISEGYLRVAPCFFYWMEADLTAMLLTATRTQKNGAVYQNPWTLGHSLHFAGIAYYHQNELHAAEEKLLPLVESPYLHHPLNYVHSAFALSLIYQTWGRADEANRVAESAVSYALDTSNTAALNIARAFLAEMALRQGRLAEASRWAEQFDAKPFTAMYRFYVPQFTMVRVLLAQKTADSRERAADLLKQLYDFTVSTHNIRFQIDVLALQALLHDSQKNEPAALKALAESLALAEPGGFIRLFLDLGQSMADLLKRLQKQNVAVDYIEKILAAFEQEGKQRVVPEPTDQPTASPLHPLTPSPRHPVSPSPSPPVTDSPPLPVPQSPSPQSLAEPLTNRELDVLELLAQRLSNQEIAGKLYISVTTVKAHLRNIYGKLNVSKRREAVETAKDFGII